MVDRCCLQMNVQKLKNAHKFGGCTSFETFRDMKRHHDALVFVVCCDVACTMRDLQPNSTFEKAHFISRAVLQPIYIFVTHSSGSRGMFAFRVMTASCLIWHMCVHDVFHVD